MAPGILLLAGGGLDRKTTLKVGFIGGFAYYLASLYWLLCIPVTLLPIDGWLALSAYISLFPFLLDLLCWHLAPAPPGYLFKPRWRQRAIWALQCAALWVTNEIIIGRFLSG